MRNDNSMQNKLWLNSTLFVLIIKFSILIGMALSFVK